MTLGAIVAGVSALILVGGFVQDIFRQLGEAIIHSQTGHVQIMRMGLLSAGSRSPEKYLLADTRRLRGLAAGPETIQTLARLTFSGLLNNGRADLPIVGQGIEPAGEAHLGSHVNIVQGRNLADTDRYGALIGEGVAKALKLGVGDHVVLLGNTLDGALNTVDLDVVGIFRSFSREFDAHAVRMPLRTVQDLLGTAGANTIVVELRRTSETTKVVAALRRKLANLGVDVVPWYELDDFYEKTVGLYDRQFEVLQLVVLLMMLLTVFNTVNMSVYERTAEFGTMRSLGNKSRRVMAMIVVENAFVGLAGALIGGLLGIGLATILSAIGIPMPPPPNSNMTYTAQIRVVPSIILDAMLIGLAATIMASLLPAARVARMPIAASLRRAT